MSIRVVPYRSGGWEVDIRATLPDGSRIRERRKSPVPSKSGTERWAQARYRELLTTGGGKRKQKAPLLSDFAPRFLEGQAKANRQKPSTIAAKELILRKHLIPFLGKKRLDQISSEDVQRLKHRLGDKNPKTVNNVLTVLLTLLKTAVEWRVLEALPCTIHLLPISQGAYDFYDFREYARIVEAAPGVDATALLIILLGGDAGLRTGEMVALEWEDVDLERRQLTVRRSEWLGHVTVPKGGRLRRLPMTARLADALRVHRHLRNRRVLCHEDGTPLTAKAVRCKALRAERRAGLERRVGVHILRHTFVSHLAMRGAPAKAIQELAGHKNLQTTMRYMHLSPAALDGAIRLLEQPSPVQLWGEIGETEGGVKAN